MNVHEYQAKEVLKKYGIPISDFAVVSDMEALDEAIKSLQLEQAVVKVQVHAGGRGKAGGVKLARNREEIRSYVEQLLGMKIVNNQTGKQGVIAKKVLLSPVTSYDKEYYLGCVMDRENARGSLIASPEGGVEIEEVAAKTPEKILSLPIQPNGTLRMYQIIRFLKFMGWTGELAKQGKSLALALAKAFVETDASLLEVNPLVRTKEGELEVLDAKLSIDENALFRQKEIAAFYDPDQVPENEAQANQHGLSYVAMEGEIGCMVNGAGLAMATMDIIHHYGGNPANFLDVGGGASKEKVAEGFKIILADPNVKAILVNIFGGIMNCVTLSAGIIAAASELEVKVPVVVRMEGTNVEQGKNMLHHSELNIQIASDLSEAADMVVAASRKGA